MKSSKTKSKIMIISLLALILIVGYGYLYWDFTNLIGQIQLSAARISNGTTQDERVITLRQTVDSITKDQTLLDSLFVDNTKVATFIQDVETLADTAGIAHTLDLDLQNDDSLSAYNKELLHFRMTTIGSWKNTIRFMTLLENMPYKIYVGTVELGVNKGEKGAVQWNGNFDFTVIKNK